MLIVAVCTHLEGAPKGRIDELASFTFDIFRFLKYLKVHLLDLYCFVFFSVYTFIDLMCCAVLCRSVMSNSLWPMHCSLPGSSVHGDSPGKNTGVGCHAVLQGIFPTQRLNLGLPHCRWILYHLSYQGSPRILEWVVYPFFRGSFLPRNQTRVSCFANSFFIGVTKDLMEVFKSILSVIIKNT